ncbi:MAG: type I-E CRISPR-associated protein Cas7/Cse4/CasC [Candidatus Alectryocaccobium sp.]|jgi:CRISPR system Cascade subunit CasC
MSKRENVYVDIHVIQTVPPSCVNRDDTGAPKQCIFGGVRRARVSSQSWKRAVRMAFRDMYAQEDVGCRTKDIVGMISDHIMKIDKEADAESYAKSVLKCAGLNIKDDPKKGTDALFFMSEAQAKALAEIAIRSNGKEKDMNKDECIEALKNNPSIDMALFGRMVAGNPSLNYDASAMVAHAISTHKVQSEFDYYTAVDDRMPEDSSGAGHLGTIEFNSSTLYRYASINAKELSKSIKNDTAKAVRNFTEAFLLSMPTGKITTFANRSIPNAVYVTIRTDQPVNLAAAFEKPIQIDEEGGYVEKSENALIKYANSVYGSFVDEPEKYWTIGEEMGALGNTVDIKNLLEEMEKYLEDRLSEEE